MRSQYIRITENHLMFQYFVPFHYIINILPCVNVLALFFIPAPHIEFTKPLHDVEVREKESAKFECEVSRENAKVRRSLQD